MRDTIHIFVPGIFNLPSAASSWVGKAVTTCIAYRKLHAEKVETFSFATIDRLLRHRRRIHLLKSRLGHYWHEGWDIHLIGHSNGTTIICDAIKELPKMHVKRIDLIAAACSGDFDANGLNDRLLNATLDEVHYFVGAKDWPLWFADTITGRLIGYGRHPLGRWGAFNVDERIRDREHRIVRHEREDLGHSGFLSDKEWKRTFEMILGSQSEQQSC